MMNGAKNKSYVIWNNKGGVGKSTITFHIASVYAQNNEDTDVIVIDMCPQANSSMMLLGGGSKGEEHVQSLISLSTPKTVVGYITSSIIKASYKPCDYIINISQFNKAIHKNMYLLSGDGNLELIAPLLSERADAKPLSEQDKPWESVHSIMKNLARDPAIGDRSCTVFIDTNPSFSVYTQIRAVFRM
jgi:chromosome partitioning protein